MEDATLSAAIVANAINPSLKTHMHGPIVLRALILCQVVFGLGQNPSAALAGDGAHFQQAPAIGLQPPAPSTGEALRRVDLASDTAWTLSIDDGPPRPIKVPGGGYNSDRQDRPWIQMDYGVLDEKAMPPKRDVKDQATYQRLITIPKQAQGHAIHVEFGAVNHGAEVYLSDGIKETLVASHDGPMMPFSADLTDLVKPGEEYTLKVKTYPLWHYKQRVPIGFIYAEGWSERKDGWASKFSFGITRHVRLAIYPRLRIRDVFVRPSVSKASLTCEVWLRNDTAVSETVVLGGRLDSWNGDTWQYPQVPETRVLVPGKSEVKVAIGPLPWRLGPDSYWWPNKPFREDYQAKLHTLNLTLRSGRTVLDRRAQRFGFVEWTEGPFYYLVNGVRINSIGDGTPEPGMSEYDCYSSSPAFLPPKKKGTGCPESWRRYMRMGICAYRTHQATPTQYMMETADEVGFMLIPETGIRGCQYQVWDDAYLPQAARELALVCRNHPSVCRYSVLNEADLEWVGPLADALTTGDDSRPIVFEDYLLNKPGRMAGSQGAHAYAMIHYRPHPESAQMISGLGECAWDMWVNPKSMLFEFAHLAVNGRRADCAHYAGWDWINYWPNFLEGMNAQRHVWKQSIYGKDRQDGIDGWHSAGIRWVQQCFHPYLVMDVDFVQINGPFSEPERPLPMIRQVGMGTITASSPHPSPPKEERQAWPQRVTAYRPGETVSRSLEVFNDGLDDAQLVVRWEARWDSADGDLVASGELTGPPIKAGFHATRALSFVAPSALAKRTVFITLTSAKNQRVVFRDEGLRIAVDPAVRIGSAAFLGADRETQGRWPGKYGTAGYEVVGRPKGLAADSRFKWEQGEEHIYSPSTADPRGLRATATETAQGIAAVRQGQPVKFHVDAGPDPLKLSLYMTDWDNQGRSQNVVLRTEGGKMLDRRSVDNFGQGVWLSWTVQGWIDVEITSSTGPNAVVNGVFFDPSSKQ